MNRRLLFQVFVPLLPNPRSSYDIMSPKWVAGLFPNHQWDVTGWTENPINITSIQAFYTYLPGGKWSVGSGPTMTYDWASELWTVPLQANAGKTVYGTADLGNSR